jgi:hypothetical protein
MECDGKTCNGKAYKGNTHTCNVCNNRVSKDNAKNSNTCRENASKRNASQEHVLIGNEKRLMNIMASHDIVKLLPLPKPHLRTRTYAETYPSTQRAT